MPENLTREQAEELFGDGIGFGDDMDMEKAGFALGEVWPKTTDDEKMETLKAAKAKRILSPSVSDAADPSASDSSGLFKQRPSAIRTDAKQARVQSSSTEVGSEENQNSLPPPPANDVSMAGIEEMMKRLLTTDCIRRETETILQCITPERYRGARPTTERRSESGTYRTTATT